MILLTLLAVTGLVMECAAAVHPGTPPPVIEDDGISIVPWQNDDGFSIAPREIDDGFSIAPRQNERHGLPPPGPWEKGFELNNPGKTFQDEELFESDIILSKEQREAIRERKAINYEGSRWPEGSDGYPLVPYVYFDTEVDRAAVKAGIDHWMEHTCIKFEETTNTDQAHLQFFKSSGCWSYVGLASSTGQQISIGAGCTSLGTVAHEIGHAMGFWHEQSRTDRDEHVAIKMDNIIEDNKHNFNKHDTNNFDVKYDYGSDMHYGSFYFHKNGKMTIVTKDPLAQELIASRSGLSHRDKLLANKMYKCIDKWVSKCGLSSDPCQNEGYLGVNCACVCPPGTSGDNCETVTGDYYAHIRSEHTETITTETTINNVEDSKFTKVIVAPECKLVKLTFTNFGLYQKVGTNSEGNSYCYYEYIFLRFGTDLTEGGIYCENDITAGQSFTSETDTMVLFAEQKISGYSNGWSAKVEFVSKPGCTAATVAPTTLAPTTLAPTTLAPTTSAPETLAPTTSAPVNLVECAKKPKTTKLKAGESIVIQSPDYPNNYPTTKCLWKLKGDGIENVKISCSNFGLEAANKNGKCKDFLKIGTEKFCGDNGPVDVIVSVDKVAKLLFKSNKKKSASGFSCTVTALSDEVVTTTAKPTETPTTKPTETNTDCNCGRVNPVTRIVGGVQAEVNEYPWMVALAASSSSNSAFCGGSIIDEEYVLTAAHCVAIMDGSEVVVVGEHRWSSSSESSVRDTVNIAQIISHPSYNPSTMKNDVALLKLSKPLTFGSDNKIAPICPPEAGNLYSNINAIVTGWGTTSSGGSLSDTLLEVTVPTMANSKCQTNYAVYGSAQITDDMICAGLDAGGKDSCQGDSGGPMIAQDSSFYRQIGVVSWGYGCAYAGLPGVYARLTSQLSWISSQMSGSNWCSPGGAPVTPAPTVAPTAAPTAAPTEAPTGDCKCGKKKVSTRIINGRETEVLEYPWQAGLVSTGGSRTWCGGSLINSNWVLTAAHCTIGSSASSIQVLLAEHDVTVSESHTERFSLKRIINHENYNTNPWTNGHDVSLLELDGKVNFETSQARPICLPTGSSNYAGAEAILTGFGMTGANAPQSNFLREVDIHVISNAQCAGIYGGSTSNYNTMICAGESDGSGGCMGDSGGPLITQAGNNYEQIGVVSFGSSSCNSYGVFARVTDLYTWIVSYTNTGNPDTCSR